MKQFLLEILTTELETDMVEPFEYLEIRKHIEEKTNQELRPVVEEIIVEAYVNEDITQEDFDAIMAELNEEEVDEGYDLDEQGTWASQADSARRLLNFGPKGALGSLTKRAGVLATPSKLKSGLTAAGIAARQGATQKALAVGRRMNKYNLSGRVLSKVADSYNIDEDFEINEIIDSILDEE